MKDRADGIAHSRRDVLDESARDDLVEKHLDLVGRVVGRMRVPLRGDFDRDDLISAGTVGLLTAARTFQPGRGCSFRTFAFMAIRAAVLDELRRHDPMPRGLRRRLRDLRALEQEFRADRGRDPRPEEIGERLGLDDDQVAHLLVEDERERLLGGGAEPEVDVEDPHAESPIDAAASRELLESITRAIEDLPERERQVVVLYHAEGLYLKEIGALLGVTESRVCQILSVAQRKIRTRIQTREAVQDA